MKALHLQRMGSGNGVVLGQVKTEEKSEVFRRLKRLELKGFVTLRLVEGGGDYVFLKDNQKQLARGPGLFRGGARG